MLEIFSKNDGSFKKHLMLILNQPNAKAYRGANVVSNKQRRRRNRVVVRPEPV